MSDDDKKDITKLKKELLTEFEEAVQELGERVRKNDESSQTYAYKIIELVKLAYLSLNEETRGTIGNYYFVRELHPAVKIVLKSSEKFATNDMKTLATEVTRLELAGIKSNSTTNGVTSKVEHVNEHSLVDEIAEKVLEKLRAANLEDLIHQDDGGQATLSSNNDITYTAFRGRFNSRSQRGQIQRDPAFKKVDFKKVRDCFSEKVSCHKKVFSLKKYHFLINS